MKQEKAMSAHNRKDISGTTINSWKVLEHVKTVGKVAYYKAICLECNTEHEVDGRNVRLGLSKRCTSCGRAKSVQTRLGKMRKGLDPKEVTFRRLFYNYRKGAKKRNYAFELSREEFESLIFKNCFYCGIKPNTTSNMLKGFRYSKEKEDLGWITYNGIDRLNNKLGYNAQNVVTCCETCNKLKMDLSYDAFVSQIELIYKNLTAPRN